MIFGPTKKSERQDEETATALVEVTELLGFEPARRRFFRWFALVNLAIWTVAGVFSSWLYYLFTEVISLTDTPGMVAVSVPLAVGFYGAYAFLRGRVVGVEDNKQLESDMMSTYQYNSDANKRWFVWIGSITFGLFNSAGVIGLVYFLGG